MKQFLIIPLLIASMAILIGFKKNNFVNHRTDAMSTELSIANVQIVEGNAGQNSFEVMVSISEVTNAPVTVAYTTRDGTATDSSDYLKAEGTVTFTPGEMVKWIKVLIIGEVVCEDDEKFEIILSNASGATLKDKAGAVTIINDDCRRGSMSGSIPGSTTIPTPIGNVSFSVYEVRLTHRGYATFLGSATDCGIRSNGKVVLTGLLAGAENVGPDDDINYKGVLQMDMNIDICSVTRLPNGEDKQCAITVIGSGTVTTGLEIQIDQRGGYIKIEHKSGLFLKNLFGSCDHAQINEEKDMVPDKTIASIFNGRDLPMLTNRTLGVGRYVETDGENETVVEVIRKIR